MTRLTRRNRIQRRLKDPSCLRRFINTTESLTARQVVRTFKVPVLALALFPRPTYRPIDYQIPPRVMRIAAGPDDGSGNIAEERVR